MSNLSTSYSSNGSNSQSSQGSRTDLVPVRVVDVIMDESHPEYEKYGLTRSIGAIKYAPVDRRIKTDDIITLPVAFPSSATLRTIPLVNEIVLLTYAPDNNASSNKSTNSQPYYTTIVSVWNHPHHNASPDGEKGGKVDLGNKFKEVNTVNPLQPYPGDILVEGRQGQSIRMSGAQHYLNEFTNQSNEGSPFTLISNGQKVVGNGTDTISEDINEDDSSIYLLSKHKAPLKQVRNKTKSWKKPPVKADVYEGSQVILNGGRLYFNAKDEHILFSSKEGFGVTSKTISLDAEEYLALDAKKVYLGEKALVEEFEPVILGESLEGFLYTLLYGLQELSKDLIKAKTIDGKIIPNLILRGKILQASIKGLQNQINPGGPSQLKSRKVYTE